MAVCICGPVRNCGPFLDKVFQNMEKIGTSFDNYHILLFYDTSTDDSLKKLLAFRKRNPRVHIVINRKRTLSPFRTHRIAYARNALLQIIHKQYNNVPFFIMMDCDDVCSKNVNPSILEKYIIRTDWDALSFQTSPSYYDIWALSIHPFCFSYNHFPQNVSYYFKMQSYVTKLLGELPPDGLLPCISAFNGFALYRTAVFLDCRYDGRVRLDLVPKSALRMHSAAVGNASLVFKDYGHVKGEYEDCEHRAFHWEAIRKGAKIRISPDVLFH